ncbi:MAG: YlbF family regulator [Defluviitaleaceae bacterium]|nr:YlbF family regulator [Defluviitaleaceae bacterium]
MFEKARELGQMILESEQSMRLADAKAALNEDENAKNAIEEINSYQGSLRIAIESGHLSREQMEKAQKRLSEMQSELAGYPVAKEFFNAQEDLDNLLKGVTFVIETIVKGGTGCGGCNNHGCGGCGI